MLSKTYRYNCQQLFELLSENNIKFWLVAGTLLGAVRDHNFIAHDSDIDIGIWEEDREKFKNVILSSDWHLFQIWRREIGIIRYGATRGESKVDVFIFDKDDKYAYMYSYMKNPHSAIWDTEWRMKFPVELFNEFVPCHIDSIKCFRPKEAEKVLRLHYTENWKIIDKEWNNNKIPIIDTDYKELAIIIPTFLRDNKLKILVDSIKTTLHDKKYRLYIADQGLYTIKKDNYYLTLQKEGHKTFFLPFNCGLSYTRNFLVSQTVEPFILLIDDDFIFTPETNIQNFIYILNSRPKLGVVGGKLSKRGEYFYKLLKTDTNFYHIKVTPKEWYYTPNTFLLPPIRFWYADIILNFSLFKRELFNSHHWDNELKMAEHSYFYYTLMLLKKWDVAFTDSVIANHQEEDNSTVYNLFRKDFNSTLGMEILNKKFKLNDSSYIILEEKK